MSIIDTYRLYLDDKRTPNPKLHFSIARNYDEFVNHILTHGIPVLVSFDHDLGYDYSIYESVDEEFREKTGYDAAIWLVNYCMENQHFLPQCYVHSDNAVGVENILSYLNNYVKFVEQREDAKAIKVTWNCSEL